MPTPKKVGITTTMEKKQWIEILDHMEAEWEEGTESTARGQLNAEHDRTYPEQGYIVVKKFKEPQEHPCEWCGDATSAIKTYSRNSDTGIWRGKCRDNACHAKKEFTSEQLNDLIEKTHIINLKKIV